MKKKMYSGCELFDTVWKILEENGTIPEGLIDYGNGDRWHPIQLKSDEWTPVFHVTYGGNEGIYADVYIEGDIGDGKRGLYHIGIIKTLYDDKESFRKMSALATEVVLAIMDFTKEHSEDFNWTGFDIQFYRGEEKRGHYWSSEPDSTISRLFSNYPSMTHAVITDNSNGHTRTVNNMCGVSV